VLWQSLRDRHLAGAKFRRQQPLGPWVVDFFCAEVRLVVEVDGPYHADPVAATRDIARLASMLGPSGETKHTAPAGDLTPLPFGRIWERGRGEGNVFRGPPCRAESGVRVTEIAPPASQ